MPDASITDLYLDDTDAFIPVARLMQVSPALSVCAHPQITTSLEIDGMVDVECDTCFHRWMRIKVREPARGQ